MNNQSLSPAIRVKAFGLVQFNRAIGQFRQHLAKSVKLLFISFYADGLSLFKLLFFLKS